MSNRNVGLTSSLGASRLPKPLEINNILSCLGEDKIGYLPSLLALPKNLETLTIIRNELMNPVHDSLPKLRSRRIGCSEPYRSAIRRFYLALDGYLESTNPVQTKHDILVEVSTNLDAALFFKRLKIKSFLETQELTLIELPDWYNNFPFYLIKDIGDIFNFSYTPHYIEESEDYLFGLQPISQCDKMLRLFREKISQLLPEEGEFRYIDPQEVLLRTTSSSQMIPGSDFETIENWKVKSQFLSFSAKPLRGKRAVIQVGPESCRDTVILPIDQVNSVTYIERQVHEIIQHIAGNGMLDNPNEILSECIKLKSKFEFFLCRDFEKEGITKPRNLILIVLEEMVKKYPGLPLIKELKSIYSGYSLSVDGKVIDLERGHGLGMANSLTTIIQIAVFYMTLDLMDCGDMPLDAKAECLAYNDDFVAGFSLEQSLESYWDLEGDVLDALGLKRKPQKSFKGTDFVFCEIYNGSLNRKESFLRRELLNTLACANIVQAKDVFSQAAEFNDSVVEDYQEEIVSYWGYEFTPKEVNLPLMFGGWKNTRYKGLDTAFEYFEGASVHFRALYEACKITVNRAPMRGSKSIEYINPIQKIFRLGLDDIPKEYHSKLNLGTERSVSRNFVRNSMNPDHLHYLYRQCMKERVKIYGLELNKPQMPSSYLRILISDENPEIGFFERSGGRTIPFYQSKDLRGYERKWDVPNPTLSFLKSLRPGSIPDTRIDANPIVFLLGNPTKIKKEISNRQIQFIERDLVNLKQREASLFEVEKYDFKFFDEEEARSHYFCPQVAAELAMLMNTNEIPIPGYTSQRRKEYLNQVNSIYKWDKTREQQIPKILCFEEFVRLMNLDEFDYESELNLVFEAYIDVFSKPVEEVEEEIPKDKPKKAPKVFTRKDLSLPDLFWSWRSNPESCIVPNEFVIVGDLLDYLSSSSTDRVEEIMEIQEIPPFWWNSYMKIIGMECTVVGTFQIPNYILNVPTGFSDDEDQFVGSFFD